jgi:fatty-acyl-CoA synthase/long-chain acyl-CoA synthetase
MADALTDLANAQGDKLALIDDRPDGTVTKWTFADLEANASRLGRVFLDLGLKPKSKIVWCGQNSVWLVACMQASRKVGTVAVPLNYRLTPEEAAYVVDNSDAECIFADAEFAPLFAEIRKDIPKVKNILIFDGAPGADMLDAAALIENADPSSFDLELDPAAAGTMIYTSGTTGKPKGAVREAVRNQEQSGNLVEMIGYRPDDVYLTTGPLYHSGPSGFLAIAYSLGNTAVLQRKFDAEDWLRLVDKYKVSTTFSAPTPVRRICQLDDAAFSKYDVSTMHVMIANAAPWSMALKKMYLERFPTDSLVEVYGSTELGVNTVLLADYQLTKPGSCGVPSPGVTITLYDEDGNEVTEPHKEGELFVSSASVISTYHKAHDKFMADRKDDRQTVGDIAYFDEEGFYYICDRKKDMIISGGMNIYPAEIESALEHHPDIMDVAVFGVPSEEWGESVHAVVVARGGSGLEASIIETYARDHLANYKAPRSFSFIEEIPRNGSGKILKRQLREPFWKDFQTNVG